MSNSNNKISINRFDDRYTSLIRPIKIFLPLRKNREEELLKYDYFVGRERLMERLFLWITDKKQKSGSYLVTGFRGMGKTSLVERTTERLTRDTNSMVELLAKVSLMSIVIAVGCLCIGCVSGNDIMVLCGGIIAVIFTIVLWLSCTLKNPNHTIKKQRKRISNRKEFSKLLVDRLVRGKRSDVTTKKFSNIKISVNLGHEVLKERDILGLIATNVRDRYKDYIHSIQPRWRTAFFTMFLLSIISFGITYATKYVVHDTIILGQKYGYESFYDVINPYGNKQQIVKSNGHNLCIEINNPSKHRPQTVLIDDNWFSRTAYNAIQFGGNLYNKCSWACLLLFYLICFLVVKKTSGYFVGILPLWGTPLRSIKRLNTLSDRIVATTDEETGASPNIDKSLISIALFTRRRHKTMPIADIREIETELAAIINDIADNCSKMYRAQFLIVFDEMDKIDPAMVEPHNNDGMPEFTDSVKGFPDGMDSRERRRSVLKLLANIKLFVSSAHAKFIFISGRELYDAYLADLSDRDFAISSIFSGVINVDSFLTPEGGQTDVRSMSEWYIANRLIPREWLEKWEEKNASENHVLKQEMPSLRWYYQYLIEDINSRKGLTEEERRQLMLDANYVVGFLHTFAAYLTHISNGSPKKIFLYFEKNIRKAQDCLQFIDWGDICTVGEDKEDEDQYVLYFDNIQQKNINFVYYLADPIMGTITNDLSNFGDRFLVSLSFIIDHIYKHHNRSFSWRNLEQIPDLLKTSKAPELRDSVTSIMEYLTQIHISPIAIGLNEYKFHKSIAEEISMMSKMSDEASAIFNFTLDESLSVIQHNTQLLNYYIELDKKQNESIDKRQYLPIIARIHTNLGDLHYWDEDYYAASLEYRSAIESLPEDNTTAGFLTKLRCMLKLGLTYELRKLYPNAYQIYGQIIRFLVDNRWIDESPFGLSVLESRVQGWRGKQQALVFNNQGNAIYGNQEKYELQFKHPLFEGNYNKPELSHEFGFNFDEAVSTLSRDLTKDKVNVVSRLTLFEEVRYVYQAILAKLSIIEKMDISGITQTNIDVAEGEFMTIHKSVNIREKFVISADFFRKLAEILYYKNSLTILTQNQDSLYASVYYGDYDLLSNLDDYCIKKNNKQIDALTIKHDVKFFFNRLNNISTESTEFPIFDYKKIKKNNDTLRGLFEAVKGEKNGLKSFIEYMRNADASKIRKDDPQRKDKIKRIDTDYCRIRENVKGFIDYNIETVDTNRNERFAFSNLDYCAYHRREFRKRGLRPPCYACRYYTRSLRISAENMFENRDVLLSNFTKAFGVLKVSFKSNLLYTGSIQVRTLAQALEGFGNVMFSCASGDKLEGENHKTGKGISEDVITLLQKICNQKSEDGEKNIIKEFEDNHDPHVFELSRLDKSILYYWDAYRFYLIDSCYNEAAGCLNKIINMIVYYIEVLCYYGKDNNHELCWSNESNVVSLLIGDKEFNNSFLATLFSRMARHVGYKYDQTNLTEINELKWIYSLELRDNIDLTRLSLYPSLRSAWLRIVETRAKGLRYLAKRHAYGYEQSDYTKFLAVTYPLIAPKRRYETTFYEEVLGYYTKLRYNDHVLNNLLGGNTMRGGSDYSGTFHIIFFEKLYRFLVSDVDKERVDYVLFRIEDKNIEKRLELIEYLIHDTLVCITNMIKTFAPHVHITSYSRSFIGITYNFYWEWVRKYEFLYSLYQFYDLREKGNAIAIEKILDNIVGGIREGDPKNNKKKLTKAMNECCKILAQCDRLTEDKRNIGTRGDRFYEHLRHDIDDITINTIFSNYAAEMALKYYKMSEEANTEGQSYKAIIGTMCFLNDDLNNDTCQFNIACDRFLLNCGVVAEQRRRLENLYKVSNAYKIQGAYIDGPNVINNGSVVYEGQFDRSQIINSEYN